MTPEFFARRPDAMALHRAIPRRARRGGRRELLRSGTPSTSAACAGGVWKTVDAGTYWRNVSDGFFTTSSVGAIAVAPSDSNVIYAGTGETTIRIDVSHGDGVYKSTDAGRTWTHIGLRDTRHIGKIRVHPHDPDTRLGGGARPRLRPQQGARRLQDDRWRRDLAARAVRQRARRARSISRSIRPTRACSTPRSGRRTATSGRSAAAGPDSGLWQSLDGGETWTNISARLGSAEAASWARSASPPRRRRPGRVWALIEHKTEGGLYRSDDLGDTWEKVSDDQNLLSRAWYYTHVTADPQDGDTVYVNNLDFWQEHATAARPSTEIPTPHGDNHDLWIDPHDNRRMIQGNDGGANVSLNGGYTWSTASTTSRPPSSITWPTDNRDPYRVYGTQQDNSSIAVPSSRQPRRDHLGRLLRRRQRRERLHRRASRQSRYRLRRRHRILARRRQFAAALRPHARPDPPDHDLARRGSRQRRQATSSTASPGPTRS